MSNLIRGLVGVASLGVVGTGVGLYAAQAPEHAASQVVVDDTAGVLHEPTLREGIEHVGFHAPTDVAVFTHRGGEEALTDDRALNDAVLAHAREWRTEWLSADERYIGLLTRPRGSPAVDPVCRIDVTSVARVATAVARPHTSPASPRVLLFPGALDLRHGEGLVLSVSSKAMVTATAAPRPPPRRALSPRASTCAWPSRSRSSC